MQPGKMTLNSQIEKAITRATGSEARISNQRFSAGGSINDSRVITLDDGRNYFVKSNASAANHPGMFAAEFEALSLLADAGMIRVPVPLTYSDEFIITEAYMPGTKNDNWLELTGRQLAQLHQKTVHEKFGFDRDNYLGTTQQPNNWCDNWLSFWRDQRLGWQLNLFARKADTSDPLLGLGDKLLVKLDELIGRVDEPPVLLHGDLWSGNADADDSGNPIIFDPASYYGQREAEIGMMRMFGGFGPVCEAAYNEVWPLPPGSEERIPLYTLYHELNHLNLFGRSYYDRCVSTMKQLL